MAAVIWVSVPFAKSLVIPLSSVEEEWIGFKCPRIFFKSACPEYYLEEFKKQKLVEGKDIRSKGKAPMKRASTAKVCGPSPSEISNLNASKPIPSWRKLPTPATTTVRLPVWSVIT